MIYSMTGYGRADGKSGDKEITVEIKSLNGKQFELNSRFTPLLKAYEPEIRKILGNALHRGSVDLSVNIAQDNGARPMKVNLELAKHYYYAMNTLAEELNLDEKDTLATLMRLPEVVAPDMDAVSENDWHAIAALLEEAAGKLTAYRQEEGKKLGETLVGFIQNIENYLLEVEEAEPHRIERIRSRISGSLDEWIGTENLDRNRLEQELIYYIEKIDFSEEKQRLRSHCSLFKKLVAEGGAGGIGKKLGFVLQETGREINTLGSKANDAIIQQTVVNMKDELEKAKEQVLNAL